MFYEFSFSICVYKIDLIAVQELLCFLVLNQSINGWQLAKMKKSIPDMSLP